MKKKKKLFNPSDQWIALNRIMHFYKKIIAMLSSLSGVLSLVIIFMAFRPPLVVTKEGESYDYNWGVYEKIKIDEATLKKAIKRYIMRRYQWMYLDPERISRNIQPLTTAGFGEKVSKNLSYMYKENFIGKKVSQTVTDLKIDVSGENISASFDKILKIEGLPLPVPTNLSLQIKKGSSTVWNPEGLYINGIIERRKK